MQLNWTFPKRSPFVFIVKNNEDDYHELKYTLPDTAPLSNVTVRLRLNLLSMADAGTYYIRPGHINTTKIGRKLLSVFGKYNKLS